MNRANGSAFSRCLAALLKGALSQFNPSMLALLVWPFLIAVVFWGVTAFWLWAPLVEWLSQSWLLSNSLVKSVSGWAQIIGISDVGGGFARLMAALLLAPAVLVTGVLVIGVVAMPIVTRYLSARHFADVERRGKFSLWANLANAAVALLVFVVGYLVSLPLWLIPPLALVVPWLWWGWLTARIMRLDSLIEHAEPDERVLLIRRHRKEYLVLGLLVSSLNYIPPLFLITPVLSALVFGHFSLARLREIRESDGLSVEQPSIAQRQALPAKQTPGARDEHAR